LESLSALGIIEKENNNNNYIGPWVII